MNILASIVIRLLSLILLFFFIPDLIAQDEHQPEFFGIFIDTPQELIEIANPIKSEVILNKEELVFSLQGKWKPQRVFISGKISVVLYGDEYAPSEIGLYKCITIIPEYNTSGNFTFKEIKLKIGPITGLPAKAYKLHASEELEEADYFLRYGTDFYPILLSRIRGTNPLKDSFYDITQTADGSIIVASDNGLYIKKNGEWGFKELRGSKIRGLFTRYDKPCAFYFLDEERKNEVGYSSDAGEAFDYISIVELLPGLYREEQYYYSSDIRIKGIINCPENSNTYYFFGKHKDAERPEREIGFVLYRDDVDDMLEWDGWSNRPVEWLVLNPNNCKVAVLGGEKMHNYYTTNGEDWDETEDKLPNFKENVIVAGVGITGNNVFSMTKDGLFKTIKSTQEFAKTDWNYGTINDYFWDEISLIIASTKGLYESPNSESHWDKISSGISNQNILGVIKDKNNSSIIYALTGDQLFISSDRGKTWINE